MDVVSLTGGDQWHGISTHSARFPKLNIKGPPRRLIFKYSRDFKDYILCCGEVCVVCHPG